MDEKVHNPYALVRYDAIAKMQITAWSVGGDSNCVQQDDNNILTGWYKHWPLKMIARYGSAGTGPLFCGNSLPVLNGLTGTAGAPPDNSANAPSWLKQYNIDINSQGVGGFETQFPYTPDSGTAYGNSQAGILGFQASQTFAPVNEALKIHYRYATFASGDPAQVFRPSIRQDVTGNVFVEAPASNINTITGTNGLADLLVDIPAATRNFDIVCDAGRFFVYSWAGPGAITSMQAIRNVTQGVTTCRYSYLGGFGAWYTAAATIGANDVGLAEYLRSKVYAQLLKGQTPTLGIIHIEGAHDRTDTNSSWNPTTFVADGPATNTPTGWYNNCLAFYRRVLQVWTSILGYSADRLFMCIGPYQPNASFLTDLANYEAATDAICSLYPSTVWATHGSQIITPSEIVAVIGYRDSNNPDSPHMEDPGYDIMTSRTMSTWDTAIAAASNGSPSLGSGFNVPGAIHIGEES